MRSRIPIGRRRRCIPAVTELFSMLDTVELMLDIVEQ